MSQWIPPWVEHGNPHPLSNLVVAPSEKQEKDEEEKKEVKQAAGGEDEGLDLKHLPPLMQAKKHGGMGGIPYDSQRDL